MSKVQEICAVICIVLIVVCIVSKVFDMAGYDTEPQQSHLICKIQKRLDNINNLILSCSKVDSDE